MGYILEVERGAWFYLGRINSLFKQYFVKLFYWMESMIEFSWRQFEVEKVFNVKWLIKIDFLILVLNSSKKKRYFYINSERNIFLISSSGKCLAFSSMPVCRRTVAARTNFFQDSKNSGFCKEALYYRNSEWCMS